MFVKDYHIPVLAAEVVELLITNTVGTYVDATMGGGGHTALLQKALVQEGRIIGFDRDPAALVQCVAAGLEGVEMVQSGFDELGAVLESKGIDQIDGILYDLGVSSRQLDDPERGFSYRFDRALDMRMDPGLLISAADILNTYEAEELVRMFREYGEISGVRRLVRSVLKLREQSALDTTGDLVKAAGPVIRPGRKNKILAQIFQAVRIEVNGELDQLEVSLAEAVRRLAPGGRVAVISYHSLEDRKVKQFFREQAQGCICPPKMVACQCDKEPVIRIVTRKAVAPQDAECALNKRARSARLRVAEKI